MKSKLLELLRCPATGEPLTLTIEEEREGEVWSGSLATAGKARTYPIRMGIPRLVPLDNYADSFGFQWNVHAKTQLDSYTGLTVSRDRLFGVTGWPADLPGERVLEAGSGAGRFTEVLVQTGAEVYSFDYSLAVEANALNNGRNENLHLFQASIFDIPFPAGTFDRVLCLGVIQHTPDPAGAFRALARQVKPGGHLAIDVYAKRFTSMLHWRFVLRPITRRMQKRSLYRMISVLTPVFLPVAVFLRRILGNAGARLMPVAEFSYLGLPRSLHRDWAILDTFDWYSPQYDAPQTLETVTRWFREIGFEDVRIEYGANGVVARGRRPLSGA